MSWLRAGGERLVLKRDVGFGGRGVVWINSGFSGVPFLGFTSQFCSLLDSCPFPQFLHL